MKRKTVTAEEILNGKPIKRHVPNNMVAVMHYGHKTAGEIQYVHKSALRRSQRQNYGTCLNNI
jgi:hypothetical protein